MGDDIDIEEHDVLENPIIKQIFPDLLVIKKEIFDYNDEIQGASNLQTCIEDTNISIPRNSNQNEPGKPLKGTSFHNNKISIHAKNNTNISKINKGVKRDIANIKVKLKNIRPELLRSQKFCQICLILFSKKEAFDDHQVLFHNMLDNSEKNIYRRNINNTEKQNVNHLYSCPICSYYFCKRQLYILHLVRKHNLNRFDIKSVQFDTKCKFCNLNYNDVSSYNNHLHRYHRNEMKRNKVDELYSCVKINDLYKHSSNRSFKCRQKPKLRMNTFKIHDKLSTESSRSIDNNHNFKKGLPKVCVIASKAILYKCIECEVHFLTSDAAKYHFQHSELSQHWKCTICQKLFKQDHRNLHEKQHKYSNCFSVVEVKDVATILYKCSICSLQIRKENLSEHQSYCELKQTDTTDGNVCDTNIENNHEVFQRKEDPLNTDNILENLLDSEKSNGSKKNNKCNSSYDSDFLTNNYKHFYFCSLCNCNIPKSCNIEAHLESRCEDFIKYICEFCGLKFSFENIDSHKILHQECNNVVLQDFKFFDLKTKAIIKPIFDLPKCTSCDKYLIYQSDIGNHLCEEDSLTCPVCGIQLTDSAFKLHEPFHTYVLNNQKVSEFSNSLTPCNTSSSPSEIMRNDQHLSSFHSKSRSLNDILYQFTCKNCDVSMNVYDEVVEHCHSHTHLNKREIDTVECSICNVNFLPSCYNKHRELHVICTKEKFKYLKFDVFYFNGDEWLNHIFRTIPKDELNKIIAKSVYKYENKIKMKIIQHGPCELTIYKCDKCKAFIDSNSIYEHVLNCRKKSEKFKCNICNISFVSNISRMNHQENHLNLKTTLQSYRIITFNRKQDIIINRNILKTKYYVLFQCRNCNVVVDKNIYDKHKCNSFIYKSCNVCGLLIQEIDYDEHILKHKVFDSFNKNVMKVVLIGDKIVNKNKINTNNLISTFSGMVCDYTFYRCVKCDVCIRELRNTSQHYCLIDAAKAKCPQCDLTFDEGKLKGHMRLHDTDPDITKDTIMVRTFGDNDLNKKGNKIKKNEKRHYMVTNVINSVDKVNDNMCTLEKVYKCHCGLHFIDEKQIRDHLNKCSVKVKEIRQDCFKCGLSFNFNILFKHLLKHHGGKNKVFKYEIIKMIR